MPAPLAISQLVERFRRQYDSYRSPAYLETQLRREFLDPFFKALGWDIDNEQGYAEAYKDVVHEDSLKIGASTKAPDYSFRIGGVRKFFVESKKPAVNIAHDVTAAFQLRRYAWSAKLPLSILTDFQEFAVYDCRIKPDKNDKASTGRTLLLGYEDYESRWDEIASVFSREAILKGSFDKYAESTRRKRGTAEVDDAFLKEIEQWRSELARNLAIRNADLSQREINAAVQKTIDRIIFLRICEDRGIEAYGQLQALPNGPNIYPRLCELFRRADDRYNSGLFHFTREKDRNEAPDEWTLGLSIDDRVLKEIIGNLYYPDCPYEFSVLEADILGQVYEQFLGKVIRLTKGHQAKVEDKPEVKKAGGVYYTPTYIVNYIVQNTVGKLLEGKHPHEIAARTEKTWKPQRNARPLSVLDPACGSGSFLIGAYQYLLDWYRDRYVEAGPQKFKDRIYQTRKDQWRLTIAERKRILLDHIYGVDIDPQAVEVTKLSLLLKVLEGENEETLQRQLRLFRERALPDLANNIKCGNSLIGPDFYNGRQLGMFAADERRRINVFDWQAEFAEIIRAGGFDAVIGNPPWGQKAVGDSEAVKCYVRERYSSVSGIYDLFRPFVERGTELVLDSGWFGMVLPDIVLLKDYPDTRKHLLDHLQLSRIDWWGRAFSSAVIDACTIIGRKPHDKAEGVVQVVVHDPESPVAHEIPQADFRRNPRYTFNLFLTPERRRILEALAACPQLGDYFEVHEGVHSGNIRSDLFVDEKRDESCRPLFFGRNEIARYRLQWGGQFIRLNAIPRKKSKERYANAGQPEWHQQSKVLVRRTGDYVLAAVDEHGFYASNNMFLVFPKNDCSLTLHGLCALLNSRAMTWFFRTIEPRKGRVFAELKIKHLSQFPLPVHTANICSVATLNDLGRQRAEIEERLATGGRTNHERTALARALNQLDAAIERQVAAAFEMEDDLGKQWTELIDAEGI